MTDKSLKPPYTSYRSFVALLKELREHKVLPGVIDRSYLSKRSGSEQSALISTLKWLGFINEAGAPTKLLRDFMAVEGEEAKEILKDAIETSYSSITDGSFALRSATTSMLADQFRQYEISGSTLSKSISFFLAAAKEVEIQVSPHAKAPPLPSNIGNSKKKQKPALGGRAPIPPLGADNSFAGGKTPPPPRADMLAIPIPIFGVGDGVIYLPEKMSAKQWTKVIAMTEFILKNYRDTMSEDSPEEIDR